MRVVVLPADETACGLYRMRYPAGAVTLAHPDWQVEVYRPGDVKLGTGADGTLWALYGVPAPDEIDVLVVQRIATPVLVQLVRWAQSVGVAVVLDADDAMWCLDKDNAAWPAWNSEKHRNTTHNHWRWLDKAASEADLVTVTTRALANRYGKHGRVEVLPNCMPAEALDIPLRPRDGALTVGWAGFTATHPHDLQVMGDAMARFLADTPVPVRLAVVGDAPGAARAWGLDPALVEQVGPAKVGQDYLSALSVLDIGVVPLADSPFNRAKSALKALEMRTMGATVVASPTPDNQRLARSMPGITVARTPEDWYEHLMAAVTTPQTVARDAGEWTYEAQAETWAVAWARAAQRRTRLSA